MAMRRQSIALPMLDDGESSNTKFGYLKHPGMRRQVYKSARPLLIQKGYTSVRFAVGCSATRCVLQYLKPRRKAVGANMQSYGNV